MSEKRKKTKLKEGGPRRSSGPPESLIGKSACTEGLPYYPYFLKESSGLEYLERFREYNCDKVIYQKISSYFRYGVVSVLNIQSIFVFGICFKIMTWTRTA
jgi:hypothetical protein